jgi:hypothetical protein
MSIDPLPLTASAPESSRGADRFAAKAHTLTLRLTRSAFESSEAPPMSGLASVEPLPLREGLLRAAVLPAGCSGLTITF